MKPAIPTPAEAVRLVFRRACMSISREYGFLAQSIEAPMPREAAVAFVKARRKAKPRKEV